MLSMPALPLFAFTCRNAAFKFSGSHISSINRSVPAGVFSPTCRRGRFSLFPPVFSGFTRQRVRKVQLHLDILLLVVLETHGLLTSPSRSGLQSPLPARPIC